MFYANTNTDKLLDFSVIGPTICAAKFYDFFCFSATFIRNDEKLEN